MPTRLALLALFSSLLPLAPASADHCYFKFTSDHPPKIEGKGEWAGWLTCEWWGFQPGYHGARDQNGLLVGKKAVITAPAHVKLVVSGRALQIVEESASSPGGLADLEVAGADEGGETTFRLQLGKAVLGKHIVLNRATAKHEARIEITLEHVAKHAAK